MDNIKQRYNNISLQIQEICKQNQIQNKVKLIAVSKTHSAETIQRAYNDGIRIFGENYVQELREKYVLLQNLTDIEWHFIGHLQSNKVKYISKFIHTIHSVDSLSLAQEISKQAIKNNRTINILIQVNTSGELTKSGTTSNELLKLVEAVNLLPNIKLIGLMTIAGLNEDKFKTQKEFKLLNELLLRINNNFGSNISELSMGMSSDFELAIKEGATMVRIGTAIFGDREYMNL